MSQILLQWETWVYGLIAGFIGGGANAVITSTVISALYPATFSATNQLKNFTVLVGVTFVTSGILSAMAYLAKSPLPTISTTTVQTNQTVQSAPQGLNIKTVETTTKESK